MAEEKIPRKKECGLSRREFLIDAGLITGGVVLGASTLSLAGCSGETVTTTVTAPGATTTVTAPGATTTVTAPGGTTTVTAPGGTTTVTTTKTVTEPGAAAIPGLITLHVNGEDYIVKIKPEWTLAFVLREKLGLFGTKVGCNRGQCGTCTIIVDGKPVYACLMLAAECEGKDILTIEGLPDGPNLHPVQKLFLENETFQCGYCTPGHIMATVALLNKTPNPTLDQVREALSGVMCWCGDSPRIINTVLKGV